MKEKKKRYTCAEYRQEMRLLGLQRRLAQESLSEAARAELLAEIRRLEEALEMG